MRRSARQPSPQAHSADPVISDAALDHFQWSHRLKHMLCMRQAESALHQQEVANGEVVRTMQLQHAKQVAKLRQEMQLTAQQMAERDRLRMHEFREEQADLYRQHAQTVEDRKNIHIQARTPSLCDAVLSSACLPACSHGCMKRAQQRPFEAQRCGWFPTSRRLCI